MELLLATDIFNNLLKRLSSVSSGDHSAEIVFLKKEDKLVVYYKSKIDKGDVSGLFCESIPFITSTGDGSYYLLAEDFLGIKIPEFTKEDKFPYCKEVCLTFSNKSVKLNYDITWSNTDKPNNVSLKLPVVGTEIDFSVYKRLVKTYSNSIEIEAKHLIESVDYCNFFKHDATSKGSNGCLFQTVGSDFLVVGTDSNVAARYKNSLIKKDASEEIKAIISSSVFKLIKGFISDIKTVRLSLSRTFLHLDTGNRKMIVPIINSDYLVSDPVEFFKIIGKPISKLPLKPISSLVSVLLNKTKDEYRTMVMTFSKTGLKINAEGNKCDKVPAEIDNEATIYVNGEFFKSTNQRLLSIDETAVLYFDESTRRITLTTPDEKLIFLIQGQRAE